MRRTALALTAALSASSGAAARADNHFLLEAGGGVAGPLGQEAEGEVGGAFAGTFGFGGRIKGFSPAYYLMLRGGYSELSQVGPGRLGAAELSREQSEISGGGRVYLPLATRVRLMVQVTFGEIYESAQLARRDHPTLLVEDERFAVFGTTGLQFRLADHFSVGAEVDLAWMPANDVPDLAALAAGIPDAEEGRGRLRVGLTTTFHF